jgi:prepilin-type N-terminal cleavage/methylation domain-containing protein
MKRRKKGFTLIELMIVIAIIAILAAVLVPNFMRAREASRLTACKSNLKSLSTAMETYSTDFDGLYPGGLNAGVITDAGNHNNTDDTPRGAQSLRRDYVGKRIACPTTRTTAYAIAIAQNSAAYIVNCPAVANTPTHRQGPQTGGPILHSNVGIPTQLYSKKKL